MTHHPGVAITLLIVIGLLARWLAWRFNLPAIVLLVVAGLVAGPATGMLDPSADLGGLLNALIGLAVAVILFEGGFNLQLTELRRTGSGVLRLIAFGVPLSWMLGSLAAHYLAGLSWPVALVLGAILVVTGPTVVVPLLRQARLRPRPRWFLKWEGIVNDPIGAVLAVVLFEYFIHTGEALPIWQIAGLAALAVAGSGVLGAATGYALAWAFGRGYVPEFLKAPSIIGGVLAVYELANLLQAEAGLLAATVMGFVMGNMRLGGFLEIQRFKEYIAVLLVSALFVALTADLDPSLIAQLDWRAVGFIVAILLLVRPAAVLLATIGAYMTWRERTLVAWIAPRGIVAAAMAGVLAPELVASGYDDAALLMPLTFAVILVTVVAHGFSIGWVARRLELAATEQAGVLIVGANAWSTDLARLLQDLDVPVLLADPSWHRLRRARLAGISTHAGDPLSEIGQETFDLSGIGYLLAATDNDAYNALLSTRFAPELGRDRVYQLPRTEEGEAKEFSYALRGRVAFSDEATYERMMRRYYRGWRFQKTQLTDEFSYEDFMAYCPPDAEQLLALTKSGHVVFHSPEQDYEPGAGDYVVCFRLPPQTEESASESAATSE